MAVPSRSLHERLATWLAAWALVARGVTPAEEPTVPLAVIGTVAEDPIDPMQRPRLSAVERERLYDQVARDAEFLERQGQQLRQLARLLQPAVVHIEAHKPALRPKFGRASEDETGSGVITTIGDRTVVLTNRHVVDRAILDNIVIRLDDGRELRPLRLWSDAGTDVAVLEIDGDDFATARMAAADSVEIGDSVLAIGSPFGLAHSLTLGIVSGVGRRDLTLANASVKFQDFIQSDAAINPGNSGGPLVNMRGEVVGINTCIASNSGGFEGLGFAIPIGMVIFVARQLVEHGTVTRGFIGVALDGDFTQTEARRLGMVRAIGARVEKTTPESPAALIGIRTDDVVLEFDGRGIEDDDHLMSLVSTTPVDSTVEIVIFRERARVPLRIAVARRATFEP